MDGRDSDFYVRRRISRGTRERSLFRIFSRRRSRRKIFGEQSVATTTAGPITQAGGEFIEYNFPRSLFDRAYARARGYVRPLDITNA